MWRPEVMENNLSCFKKYQKFSAFLVKNELWKLPFPCISAEVTTELGKFENLKLTTADCWSCRCASKYFGLTWIPWDGRGDGDSECLIFSWLVGRWLSVVENWSSSSILPSTEEGKTCDHVPKRWRMAGCMLVWTWLYASQNTLQKPKTVEA